MCCHHSSTLAFRLRVRLAAEKEVPYVLAFGARVRAGDEKSLTRSARVTVGRGTLEGNMAKGSMAITI